MLVCFIFVFFFKQKTAYEMRISDWSSDVCSSDLVRQRRGGAESAGKPRPRMRAEQAFVEEAVGDEAGQAILPEVEGRHRDQRRHEMFERVEPAVVGDMRANFDEPVIDARLDADRKSGV